MDPSLLFSLHSPKQLVVLLICIGGDVDGGFILLHKFQELTGVQARVTIIKILERGRRDLSGPVCSTSSIIPPLGWTHLWFILFLVCSSQPCPGLFSESYSTKGSDPWAPREGVWVLRWESESAWAEATEGLSIPDSAWEGSLSVACRTQKA